MVNLQLRRTGRRLLVLFLLLWLWHSPFLWGDEVAKIEASAISSEKVLIIGRLGLPLGTVCRVEGVFFDGTVLKMKAFHSIILMRVTKVNGSLLAKAALFRFRTLREGVIPDIAFGQPFDIFGYETGEYVGIPAEAWSHTPAVANTDFFFETSFVVLRENSEP